VTEYAIYGASGELPELGVIQAVAGDALVEIRTSTVPADWGERWKRFYHPLLLGGRLYVRPPWERPAERGGVVEMVIDPGRAFGTGTHPTTRMCLELILAEAGGGRTGAIGRLASMLARRGPRSACDVGCGSGVLAIAAAKLGFGPVLALDSEEAALEETARNARLNYVELERRRFDVREQTVPAHDLVTANLTADLLARMAERWEGGDRRPGSVIASGFLNPQADRVAASLAAAGLTETRRLGDGEWGALIAAG
jgi:ribosomal protein L11 methyltransferase